MQLQAGLLSLEIGPTGGIEHLAIGGREHLAPSRGGPLLRVALAGRPPEAPSGTRWSPDGCSATLDFPSGTQLTLAVRAAPTHLAFRVAGVAGPAPQLLLWGPFAADLRGEVGESIGVVRDGGVALGIQSLDPWTMGGWPAELAWPGGDAPPAGPVRPDRQECAAWPAAWGTLLLAYARAPSPPEALVGGGAALFASAAADALEALGRIETAEGLPHPVLGGAWAKRSPEATASYLIADFGEDDVEELAGFARAAGLRYLYHGNPFRTWGHFELDPRFFPGGVQGLAGCARRAAAAGVRLGLHTLSNFVTTNDAYVTPRPDPRLQRRGAARLAADASADDPDLAVDAAAPVGEPGTLGAAVAGEEIIQYGQASPGSPPALRGCRRGAFGTAAAGHAAGTALEPLADHPYRVFLAGPALQDEMADRLADLLEGAELAQISFDGLEGCLCGGQGPAAEARFVLRTLRAGAREVINDASRLNHFTWHVHTRMNWGEPWGAAMREGMPEYRFANQAYFDRNLLPRMLGWFLFRLASADQEATTLDDIEWALARAAGYDAGFALVAGRAVLGGHGQAEAILGAVREWEAARAAGAFSAEQRRRLRDPGSDWHLAAEGPGRWRLSPLAISAPEAASAAERQPGQPAGFACALANPFGAQAPGFRLRARRDGGPAEDPAITAGGRRLAFRGQIAPGQYLVYEGGGTGRLYDADWRAAGDLPAAGTPPVIGPGGATVTLDCGAASGAAPALEVRWVLRGPAEAAGAAPG